VVVQKQRNLGSELSGQAAAAQKVRRGDISHAIVVRTKKKYGRPDGSFVRFDDNACVLINKAGDPMGTRLNGGGYSFFFFLHSPLRNSGTGGEAGIGLMGGNYRCCCAGAAREAMVQDFVPGTSLRLDCWWLQQQWIVRQI